LNGYSIINGVKFFATVEKMQFEQLYTAYLKSPGELAFSFVEEDLFGTFNVGLQDFWPENSLNAISLIKQKLELHAKIL